MVSYVGWSFLLLGNKERECVLCHIGWLVLLKRPAWKSEEGEKWLAWPFMLPRGGDQGRMASVIPLG